MENKFGGSCSDGVQRSWEKGPPDPSDPTDGAMSEVDAGIVTRQTVEAMAQGCGKGSGHAKRWAAHQLVEIADPKTVLMRIVRKALQKVAGPDHETYSRSSRRRSTPFMPRPSTYSIKPRVTIILDTSGSMGRDDTNLAIALIGNPPIVLLDEPSTGVDP